MTRHDQAKPETWKTDIPSNLQPAEQTISVKLNLNTTKTKSKQGIIQTHPCWSFSCSECQSLCARLFYRRLEIHPVCLCAKIAWKEECCVHVRVCVPFASFLPYFLSLFFLALLSEKGIKRAYYVKLYVKLMSLVVRESAPHERKPLTKKARMPEMNVSLTSIL